CSFSGSPLTPLGQPCLARAGPAPAAIEVTGAWHNLRLLTLLQPQPQGHPRGLPAQPHIPTDAPRTQRFPLILSSRAGLEHRGREEPLGQGRARFHSGCFSNTCREKLCRLTKSSQAVGQSRQIMIDKHKSEVHVVEDQMWHQSCDTDGNKKVNLDEGISCLSHAKIRKEQVTIREEKETVTELLPGQPVLGLGCRSSVLGCTAPAAARELGEQHQDLGHCTTGQATCLCQSIKAPTTSSQESFKTNLFNFYHSLILADGKETTIHLLKDIPKRYYFALEEGRVLAPFSITVTPCDVPIEWSILVYKSPPGKATPGHHDTQEVSKSQKASSIVSTIFNYKGNSVETYMGMSSHSALYLLEFLSTERDTHITVYLTTDTTSGLLYPELPADPRIDIIGIGHTTVTLTWKHSPSVLQHKESIQYCLLVNEKHNYKSFTQYYFDVFIVNLLTNASAAYTGTFARTLEEPGPKVTELKDGKVIHVVLDGKKQKFYSLQYQARHKKILLTFQLCRGQIRVHITRNGKTVASENLSGLRYFSLKGKLLDTYLVQLRSTEEFNSSVKVQASPHFHKPLFPLLPESLKIKSFSKLRTCRSVTIAWLGTQEESKYCVYRKRIEEEQIWRELQSADRCSGPESRHKSEKVLCKYFYDLNLQRAVTTETIKGLEAGTLYLFDVYLFGPSGIPVRYHSKVVKTRKKFSDIYIVDEFHLDALQLTVITTITEEEQEDLSSCRGKQRACNCCNALLRSERRCMSAALPPQPRTPEGALRLQEQLISNKYFSEFHDISLIQ
ncbi:Protein NDNF, partial [Lamprotornis superbus]